MVLKVEHNIKFKDNGLDVFIGVLNGNSAKDAEEMDLLYMILMRLQVGEHLL